MKIIIGLDEDNIIMAATCVSPDNHKSVGEDVADMLDSNLTPRCIYAKSVTTGKRLEHTNFTDQPGES